MTSETERKMSASLILALNSTGVAFLVFPASRKGSFRQSWMWMEKFFRFWLFANSRICFFIFSFSVVSPWCVPVHIMNNIDAVSLNMPKMTGKISLKGASRVPSVSRTQSFFPLASFSNAVLST